MNRNSNLSPLPFYRTIEEQSFRQSYAYGLVYPLFAPKNRFLPFQIVTTTFGTLANIKVEISNFDGTVRHDITEAMRDAGLTLKTYGDYKVISFPGLVDKNIWKDYGLDFNKDFTLADFGGEAYRSGEGRAYFIVSMNGETWYSDVMTLVGDLSGLMKIEWYSYRDLTYDGGRIAYQDNVYSNIMYVMREIGMPTYEFSDDGQERNGRYYATKQISEKTYHFSFLATEPVCDALRIASLSDVVLITDQHGRQYQCDTFLSTPTWQGQGYLASVECEFQTDTMVVQPAKVVEQELMQPRFFIDGVVYDGTYHIPASGVTAVMYILPNLPDMHFQITAPWGNIYHMYDNAYKISIDASATPRSCTVTVITAHSSNSIVFEQG